MINKIIEAIIIIKYSVIELKLLNVDRRIRFNIREIGDILFEILEHDYKIFLKISYNLSSCLSYYVIFLFSLV